MSYCLHFIGENLKLSEVGLLLFSRKVETKILGQSLGNFVGSNKNGEP